MQVFRNKQFLETLLLFVAWRIWITVFALFGIVYIAPYSRDLFGGGFNKYLGNPLFWGWGNFDGEHYISIAQYGYRDLEHSFFPLYPALTHVLAPEKSMQYFVLSGIIISNSLFLAALLVLRKLVRDEFGDKVARLSLVSLLVFPTSFYFGAIYTESLFLLMVLLSFYFVSRQKWVMSGIFAALTPLTRIQGVLLLPSFLLEALKKRTFNVVVLTPIICVVLGFVGYLFYLHNTTGSAMSFYTDLESFGVQREVGRLITFPQVVWRYLKILTSLDIWTQQYLITLTEFLTAILGVLLLFVGYAKKVKWSYLLFAVLSLILPTLSGSFSSLPRYFLVIFPYFILLGVLLEKTGKSARVIIFGASAILLAVQTALFVTGHWVG